MRMWSTIDRLRRNESGFTLIEMMVVVLIVAILIAIAVPTFAGARTRAQDRAAQVSLRNALVVGETFYADEQSFAMTAAELVAIEPDLQFDDNVNNASTGVIGIAASATEVVFVRRSQADTYFCIGKSESAPGTLYGSAAAIAAIDTLAECNASSW